ncbi:MAG: Fe-S protein [Hyphomicrobiales bacterium]
MFLYPRSRKRPFHLGPFPLETLPRDLSRMVEEGARPPRRAPAHVVAGAPLSRAAERYRKIFARFVDGDPAPAKAPVPDDLDRRVQDIKGGAYFMDASQVGICAIPDTAWFKDTARPEHTFAIVILVEQPPAPKNDPMAAEWIDDALPAIADMRAAEIAVCIAGHIRMMGFSARAHIAGESLVDQDRLAVLAGLALRDGAGLTNPYAGRRFALASVSTDYALSQDDPLGAAAVRAMGLHYWWGINGARSGRERRRRARRPSHASRYPMEQVKRIDRPTTLIMDDEVPRVPKRAAFFQRALHGDLGEKSKHERSRFAFKTPFSMSLLNLIRSMVPHQDGDTRVRNTSGYRDPAANARAVKTLSYALGSDLTGICEIPNYAWFSHQEDGEEIHPYHRYAVVMLIDQGYDTMEAASGDDWASGPQSMRSYLRGAEIAGIMAEFLRDKGFAARSQTNADSDVLHIPLILWAGLGELSRIGELVLNPFVGPRFKSVVLTTEMPLEIDKPIDFGLQEFCNNCLKCARECPCDAIPFGDKIMFNGYEMWKPDVERCTRYRLTNQRGAACGRCMKTCPINKVVDADGAVLTRIASWLGVNAMWLKPVMVPIATRVDDWLGNGRRNLVKKWWFDHEVVDGVTVDPPKGTNERDIDPKRKVDPAKQKMAYYPANAMPPPDVPGPVPLDRKAAMAAAAALETPEDARERMASGDAAPAHYAPTPPSGAKRESTETGKNPYK